MSGSESDEEGEYNDNRLVYDSEDDSDEEQEIGQYSQNDIERPMSDDQKRVVWLFQ